MMNTRSIAHAVCRDQTGGSSQVNKERATILVYILSMCGKTLPCWVSTNVLKMVYYIINWFL